VLDVVPNLFQAFNSLLRMLCR